MAYLIAKEGALTGIVIDLSTKDKQIIGRDPKQSEFVLEDDNVSRKHVVCNKVGDEYHIKNLSKVNPVLVNGKDINDEYVMKEGDEITLGLTRFTFSLTLPKDIEKPEVEVTEPESDPFSLTPEVPSNKEFLEAKKKLRKMNSRKKTPSTRRRATYRRRRLE